MIQHKQLITLFLLFITGLAVGQTDDELMFKEKAQEFLNQVSDSFELPSPKSDDAQKYYWPYLMARLELFGNDDQIDEKYIKILSQDLTNYYGLVGSIRALYRYPDCFVLQENMQVMVKNVFEAVDGSNAWTGEGTESQVSMYRTSGFLYAQKALAFGNYFGDLAERLAEMKTWILDWSSRIYEVGSGEFNSSKYGVYNLLGWINLYDYSADEEVKLAARAVLDYYAAEMALHYSYGLVGGAELMGTSPARQKETALYFLNWLWFSTDSEVNFSGNNYIQLLYAATSAYRPPKVLVDYVRQKPVNPEWYLNSKPAYLLDQPSFNKEYYYRTKNYTLGSLISTYGGWTKMGSEIVNWKLIVNNQDTISEVRGNGAFWGNSDGLGKDPWTQWGQYENILIQLTKVPVTAKELHEEISKMSEGWDRKWKRDFKKRFPTDRTKNSLLNNPKNREIDNISYVYFPKDLRIKEENGIWFIDFGVVYMSIVGIPAYQNTNLASSRNQNVLSVKNDPGKVCGFALELHDSDEFENFEAYQSKFIREHIMYLDPETQLLTYESFGGGHIEMLFQDVGFFQEPIVNWGYGIDEPKVLQHLAPFEQPQWPVKGGTGTLPVFIAGNTRYNYDERWPVFSGPVINLDHSILTISFGGNTYLVDYSNQVPVFSENE
ncbi:hypothetical protein ACUNWD_10105 [Sunxiuqinia sp. A32]|uniref:hypothetical protein n=1 Tax=Sunxiuqinia sp. A32 TaxID=3461496 RepID=UPI004045E588